MFSRHNMGIKLEVKTKTMMHKERRDLGGGNWGKTKKI